MGWSRSDFHALAAQCEVLDAEGLRAELFRARALGDGLRHRKLLTFALDHIDMNPTSRDVELVERSLSELDSTGDVEVLTDLLARAQAKALKFPRRSTRRRAHHQAQQPAPTRPSTIKPRPRSRIDNTAADRADNPTGMPADNCPSPDRSARA